MTIIVVMPVCGENLLNAFLGDLKGPVTLWLGM